MEEQDQGVFDQSLFHILTDHIIVVAYSSTHDSAYSFTRWIIIFLSSLYSKSATLSLLCVSSKESLDVASPSLFQSNKTRSLLRTITFSKDESFFVLSIDA